jgi:hypothetical protein
VKSLSKYSFAIALAVLLSSPAWAQMQHHLGSGIKSNSEPCWKQVGISKSANQMRNQINEDARGQVRAVCANSSLTTVQKKEQIHQIWETAAKQRSSVITPQEEEALKTCREQEGLEPKPKPANTGPCGEPISAAAPPATAVPVAAPKDSLPTPASPATATPATPPKDSPPPPQQ